MPTSPLRCTALAVPNPAMVWYDFNTGQAYRGGQSVTVAAPYDRMPLFVKAGAIVPMGPVTQYVDQKPDALLTLTVYPGANGSFGLYEDDGTSEQYRGGVQPHPSDV